MLNRGRNVSRLELIVVVVVLCALLVSLWWVVTANINRLNFAVETLDLMLDEDAVRFNEHDVWQLGQERINDRLYDRIDRLDAEMAELQWQILDIRDNLLYLKPDLDTELSFQIARAISLACDAYDIDPDLAIAIAYYESGFNPNIRGRDGEYGLFQIMPWWCSYYHLNCDPKDLLDPVLNAEAGMAVFRYCLDLCKGKTVCALQKYNGSYPSTKYSDPVLKIYRKLQKAHKDRRRR